MSAGDVWGGSWGESWDAHWAQAAAEFVFAHVQAEIYARLIGSAAIVSLVHERITPQVMDEPANFPAITYGMVSTLPVNSLGGFNNLVSERAQIDIWSRDYDEALALEVEVRNAIIGSNDDRFKARWVDKRETYESDVKLYSVQQDFLIWFKELIEV